MVSGKVLVIGNMEIDGGNLTGMFIECSVSELKKGRNMFAEKVAISPLKTEAQKTDTQQLKAKIAEFVADCEDRKEVDESVSIDFMLDRLRQLSAI